SFRLLRYSAALSFGIRSRVERSPWRTAFMALLSFPDGVTGPLDRLPFTCDACVCTALRLVIFKFSSSESSLERAGIITAYVRGPHAGELAWAVPRSYVGIAERRQPA